MLVRVTELGALVPTLQPPRHVPCYCRSVCRAEPKLDDPAPGRSQATNCNSDYEEALERRTSVFNGNLITINHHSIYYSLVPTAHTLHEPCSYRTRTTHSTQTKPKSRPSMTFSAFASPISRRQSVRKNVFERESLNVYVCQDDHNHLWIMKRFRSCRSRGTCWYH